MFRDNYSLFYLYLKDKIEDRNPLNWFCPSFIFGSVVLVVLLFLNVIQSYYRMCVRLVLVKLCVVM